MKGFDTKALLLFPKMEHYEHREFAYKYQFKQALDNIIAYLNSAQIQPHAFYTDDVARELQMRQVQWVSPIGKADRFFISKYCDGCGEALDPDIITFDKVYDEVLKKDPDRRDMDNNERFDMVLRHTAKGAAKIIPQYKIVVHFMVPNKCQYHTTTKPNDGKIRINIDTNSFFPTAYMSGKQENICDLLQLPCASRCVQYWEVQ